MYEWGRWEEWERWMSVWAEDREKKTASPANFYSSALSIHIKHRAYTCECAAKLPARHRRHLPSHTMSSSFRRLSTSEAIQRFSFFFRFHWSCMCLWRRVLFRLIQRRWRRRQRRRRRRRVCTLFFAFKQFALNSLIFSILSNSIRFGCCFVISYIHAYSSSYVVVCVSAFDIVSPICRQRARVRANWSVRSRDALKRKGWVNEMVNYVSDVFKTMKRRRTCVASFALNSLSTHGRMHVRLCWLFPNHVNREIQYMRK